MVITGGGFILAASLLPMLRRGVPAPPLSSSATLAAVLTAYAVALGTLGLYASVVSTGLQVAAWGFLAVRKYRGG